MVQTFQAANRASPIRKGKVLFSEEKKQKTFVCWRGGAGTSQPRPQRLLAFVKKAQYSRYLFD
jgi:hypothetical protein